MVMLEWLGYGFGDLLNQLEQLGFFAYILPFMLIFAFSYAILYNLTIFSKNKGAAAIVAFALGLLALQFDFVPSFFRIIIPKFGAGLVVLLIGLILGGIFISEETKIYRWIFFGLGTIIFLIIIMASFSEYNIGFGFWEKYGTLIIVGVLIIGGIVAVIFPSVTGQQKSSSG